MGAILLSALGLYAPPAMAGIECRATYTLWAYYSSGQYTGSEWEVSGVYCFETGGDEGGDPSGDDPMLGDGGMVLVGGKVFVVPNNPYTQNDATCTSGSDDRYLHAAGDFGGWKATTKPTQISGKGELLVIEYDDGGKEEYNWIYGRMPSASVPPETYLARVPGTLRCPVTA